MPGAACAPTASRANKESTRVSHHRFAEDDPAFPARWLYGLLHALPGDRAFLSPSPRNAKHCRELTSASRRQNHMASPYACSALVSRTESVHRIPHPTSVTIAIRPSCEAGRGKMCP
jgi:hypothetical protein